MDLERDFQILMDYKAQRKEELPQNEEMEDDGGEKEKICIHEGVETEEDYVCCKCGLVLDNIYRVDVHWFDHATEDREYNDSDRLQAVDKTLIKFMEKSDLRSSMPLFSMQQCLRSMKINSGYKNLNYAIALTCILGEDEEAQEKISQFLPRSNISWVRSMHVLKPVPEYFVKSWLRNLLKQCPTKDLSRLQKKIFYRNLKQLNISERQIMQDLLRCYYGVAYEDENLQQLGVERGLERLPLELRHALHRFSLAVSNYHRKQCSHAQKHTQMHTESSRTTAQMAVEPVS